MEPNQAAEQLQAIRTLMERSAIYRRALAPIMTYCGVVGIIGGIVGDRLSFQLSRGFIWFWAAVAVVALTGSILLVRRQALKDSEPFWSPPTRRVLHALTPPFVCGGAFGILCALNSDQARFIYAMAISVWCVSFGLGIYSAGFFMPRGLKLFGWLFIIIGFLPFLGVILGWDFLEPLLDHASRLMGGIFGGLHLAYGIYLYFTEKRGMTS
jgi:hypothetical protein